MTEMEKSKDNVMVSIYQNSILLRVRASIQSASKQSTTESMKGQTKPISLMSIGSCSSGSGQESHQPNDVGNRFSHSIKAGTFGLVNMDS
jgi:hypothetical protein